MAKYMDPTKLGLLEKSPLHLTAEEWAVIMDAFLNWPFHPTVSPSIRLERMPN